MPNVVVRMTPDEWSTAWRPADKRLLLALPGTPAKHQKVAVRIELAGHILHATVVGTVAGVQRVGARVRADVAPDAASAGALALLDAAARGETVGFRERPRRYLVKIPVRVVGCLGEVFMPSVSLSAGGCSLRWSGPPPRVGEVIRMRFGAASSRVTIEGAVRWVRAASGTTVGMRFVDPRSASILAGVLGAVERSHAPTI
jgi:hypothetical protein